ncbi:MAG: hypothetical protein ABIA67_05105 [Candidatus Margulisiibacteriota bacterium]
MNDFFNVCAVFGRQGIIPPFVPGGDKSQCCQSLSSISEEDKKYLEAYLSIDDFEEKYLGAVEKLPAKLGAILRARNGGPDEAKKAAFKKNDFASVKVLDDLQEQFLKVCSFFNKDKAILDLLSAGKISQAREMIIGVDKNDGDMPVSSKRLAPGTLQKLIAMRRGVPRWPSLIRIYYMPWSVSGHPRPAYRCQRSHP